VDHLRRLVDLVHDSFLVAHQQPADARSRT